MIYRTINLDLQMPDVTLTTYIPEATSEYQEEQKIPAVIICPGGAYQFLSDREGEPIALRYNSKGYAAFVLRYRIGMDGQAIQPMPLLDLGRAIVYVKNHAEEWRIDEKCISICGFSAGGHLCASYATMWHHSWITEKLKVSKEKLKPCAAVVGYPVADMILTEDIRKQEPTKLMNDINVAMFGKVQPEQDELCKYSPVHQVDDLTIPCLIWHTAEDELVDVRNSLHFAEALYMHRIPFQLHIYPWGKHGLALSDRTTDCGEGSVKTDVETWFEAMVTFMGKIQKL